MGPRPKSTRRMERLGHGKGTGSNSIGVFGGVANDVGATTFGLAEVVVRLIRSTLDPYHLESCCGRLCGCEIRNRHACSFVAHEELVNPFQAEESFLAHRPSPRLSDNCCGPVHLPSFRVHTLPLNHCSNDMHAQCRNNSMLT